MNFLVKSLIKFFQPVVPLQAFYFTPNEQFICAQTIFRIFYAIIFFLSVLNLSSWENYLSTTTLDPLWPIFWLSYVNLKNGIIAILGFQFFSSILGLIFPHNRIVRLAIFLSLLELIAFKNSFDKIFHQDHLSLLLSFVLIFLPYGWHLGRNTTKSVRTATLMFFVSSQALIMLTFTMSGLGKIIYSIIQALQGEVHTLAPQGLATHIAQQLLTKNISSFLGPWLINHYHVAWLLMIGTLYLQFFALWAVFCPSLHQWWALGLILFHLGVYFTMMINFEQNCLWLALFFLNSPFRPRRFDLRQTIQELPLIDLLVANNRKYSFNMSINKSKNL